MAVIKVMLPYDQQRSKPESVSSCIVECQRPFLQWPNGIEFWL